MHSFQLIRTRVQRGWLCEARTSDGKVIRPRQSGAFWWSEVYDWEYATRDLLLAEGYRDDGYQHRHAVWIDTVDHDDPRLVEVAYA